MSNLFRTTGRIIGETAGTVIGEPIKFVGKKVNSDFVTEIGDGVKKASVSAGDTTGQFIGGAWNTANGVIQKDQVQKKDGLDNIWDSTSRTAKGIGNTVVNTAKQGEEIYSGIREGDHEKAKKGAKGIAKTAVIATLAVGTIDLLDGFDGTVEAKEIESFGTEPVEYRPNQADFSEASSIEGESDQIVPDHVEMVETINQDLEGEFHPITDVPFERDTVILSDSGAVSGVFPNFDEVHSTQIPESMYLSSDAVQFRLANDELANEIEQNVTVRAQFTPEQLAQIDAGETPDGYVWHHHQQPGQLELIDEQTHALTGHSGGRSLWGGGAEYR